MPDVAQDAWDKVSYWDMMVPFLSVAEAPVVAEDVGYRIWWVDGDRGVDVSALCQGTSTSFDLVRFLPAVDRSDLQDVGAKLVGQARTLSGLTWEKLAELIGVSSRTIHYWADGEAISEKNLDHLSKLVAVLEQIDRGYGEANRNLLLGKSIGGLTLFEMLGGKEYDKVLDHLGVGEGRPVDPPAHSRDALQYTGPDHFGDLLSIAIDDATPEVEPFASTSRRRASAHRKG